MSEESQDNKSIKRNRIIVLILLLAVVGGLVWAHSSDNDIIAAIICLVGGIAFGIFGSNDKNPLNGIGTGIVAGAILFFLYMAVRFLTES